MMITRREFLSTACGVAFLGILPGVVRAAAAHVYTGPAFGSAYRLVLPDTDEAGPARLRLESVIARIDALMSPFREDSELARFNASGSTTLSPETRIVARAALELARDSAGAFDPTVAPLGRRYGFGPAAISPTRPAGRHRDLSIAGNLLASPCPGLSIDLCGIAKGYALDAIAAALDGLEFLLELGGEIICRGRHPSGRPWRMGIERPGTNLVQCVIEADGRVLATSGDGAQGYVVGGRQYAHVLDPRTGAPIENDVAAVSVLADTGMIADGLATAAMVLGPEAARPLLRQHGASALFLLRRPGGLAEVDVNGFDIGNRS